MRHKVIALTIALAAAVLLQACGHDGGGRHGRGGGEFMARGAGPGAFAAQIEARELQLRRFDADADGKITRAEFDKVIKADYAVCDANGDGELSIAETRTCNERILTDHNTSPIIDWNADGHVGLDEFAAQWRTLFETADADNDGVVTAEELAARARPRGEHGGPGGPGGPGGGQQGPGGRRPRGGN